MDIYLNVKSAVAGGRKTTMTFQRQQFFLENIERQLFICTFAINFRDDMSNELVGYHVILLSGRLIFMYIPAIKEICNLRNIKKDISLA